METTPTYEEFVVLIYKNESAAIKYSAESGRAREYAIGDLHYSRVALLDLFGAQIERIVKLEAALRDTLDACDSAARWIDGLAYYYPGSKHPGIDDMKVIAARAHIVLDRAAEDDDGDDGTGTA
jgi:hypothetical protein